MRLAFAVAAHLEPEILIVDEVLAVGDAEFQKKCLGKMNEVSQKRGRTVLFVSHNIGDHNEFMLHGDLDRKGFCAGTHGSDGAVVATYLAQRIPNQEQLVSLTHLRRPQEIQDDRLRCRFYRMAL